MPITPASFGAVPYSVDPTYINNTEILACLSDGRMVDGEGIKYRVTQDFRGPWSGVKNLVLFDDNPRANRRTFWPDGSPDDAELDVAVEWAGDSPAQLIGDCAQIWITAPGEGLRGAFRGKGSGRGSSVALHDAAFFDVRLKWKDRLYETATALTDDAVQGLWLNRSRMGRAKVLGNRAGGLLNGSYTRRFSRGAVVSASADVALQSIMEMLDQGVDLTGAEANNRINVHDSFVKDAYSFAFASKLATRWCSFNRCTSTRANYAAFIVSGTLDPNAATPPQDTHITDCTAIDSGASQWVANLPAGALVTTGATAGYPLRTFFNNFHAEDSRPAGSRYMVNGIRTQQPSFKDGACVSIGHTGAAFDGTFTAI